MERFFKSINHLAAILKKRNVNKQNIEVKDQFNFFNELVYEEKIILDKEIILRPKKTTSIGLKANLMSNTILLVKVSFL